jgi:hypothetical protein
VPVAAVVFAAIVVAVVAAVSVEPSSLSLQRRPDGSSSSMVSEVSNIGPREQRKRRLLGIVALTVGVAAAFLLVVYDAPRLLRAVVFFPVWIAGLGLLQAREKT